MSKPFARRNRLSRCDTKTRTTCRTSGNQVVPGRGLPFRGATPNQLGETGDLYADNNPIATYRTEKAAALERWKRRGWTPVSSGRHPLTGPVTRQSA